MCQQETYFHHTEATHRCSSVTTALSISPAGIAVLQLLREYSRVDCRKILSMRFEFKL